MITMLCRITRVWGGSGWLNWLNKPVVKMAFCVTLHPCFSPVTEFPHTRFLVKNVFRESF
jgi:hypothetical protein